MGHLPHGLRKDQMPRKQKEEKQEHIHHWEKDYNESEVHCRCGFIKISKREAELRAKEWDEYFAKVRDSDAYGDYQLMNLAYKEKNKPLIKEIMQRIKERNHWEEESYETSKGIITTKNLVPNNPIPKPHFPDPTTWNKYEIDT